MKILFDTNVLFPAWLYLTGVCAKAFNKAIEDESISVIVCTHSVEEFLNVCNRKYPGCMNKIRVFLSDMLAKSELVRTPPEREKIPEEDMIRDVKDRPILRAAVAAGVDMIVTWDKDFLEAGLAYPRIVSPVDFVNF